MKKLLFIIAILATSAISAQCPTFELDQSNGYYVLFTSNSSITFENDITINGLDFTGAGNWVSNGTHHVSWSNTTGQALDLSNFTMTFGSETCSYPENTLSNPEYELDLQNIPIGEDFYVLDIDGRILYTGITDVNTYTQLPKERILGLIVGKYKMKKLYKV